MAESQVQMSVLEGGEFFAHEVTVNFTPLQFSLDCKSITPRSDPRTKGRPSFVIRHNVIMLEPWHAKIVHEILGNLLQKYEEEFGKIKKPKALEKAEKKQKQTASSAEKPPVPAYFG
ncbi:MAG: hypothetical protein Q7K43_05580 [Candidatus Woesearchaeota archaeon]|nr:hypothetical protein [Candidatus Woesearchaeota archaeon]